jgi:signal transduction histidine kinase/ActR/RegA family two-component response regulator
MVRTWFRRLPVRHKLVTMIMATTTAALLLSSAGYLFSEYQRSRGDLEEEMISLTELLLENSSAALRFKDPRDASAVLHTLSSDPHVRAACLYLPEGNVLAEFRVPGAQGCPAAPREGFAYSTNRVELVRRGMDEGKHTGTVYIRTDIQHVTTRLQVQAAIVVALLLATLGVALFLSARLQFVVSDPVVGLARTASEVSARGDYSLRATRTTDDELGVLVDAFNRMLERIQTREEELSRANDDLRREVAERRRAEQERAQLLVREREANRLKDEFLATLSHELRTPLNAILGWTKLLRANAVPSASVDRALEKIERNAQVQTRLVEDLLEVSRITSGKLRLELKTVDLVPIVNTAIDSIRPTAEARGVAVERQFDLYSMPTLGDSDRLQQVIWNLLSNAVKFTPPRGVVTVRLSRNDGVDEIAVSDTGIGIDPAFLPSVFDTFRQADASSTRTHGGLGLGLSIVRHLVEMHGGEVKAESGGLGAGATFTVKLPVRVEPAIEPPSEVSVPPAILTERRLGGNSVLVVDDDEDTRELLVSVLEAAGATVYAAHSAPDALALGVQYKPQAIVSDIAMPGQDGYSLMRDLDAALGHRAPRVRVALTAFAGERDRNRAFEAGYHRHLAKPFDPAGLIRLLEELLQADSPRAQA